MSKLSALCQFVVLATSRTVAMRMSANFVTEVIPDQNVLNDETVDSTEIVKNAFRSRTSLSCVTNY
jgi:hypothetical protein